MSFSFAQQPWPKLPADFSFRMVSNLAEDSLGRLYVVHRGAQPLVRFDAEGNFLGSLADSVITLSINYDLGKNPPAPIGCEHWLHGLHVDPWDNIWITDLGRHLVMKFDPKGELLLTLGRPDLPGEELNRFNQPTAVAVGRSGHVYVADGYGNSRVVKYAADGRPLQAWGRKGSAPGEFHTPHGLALDEEENVYVAERLNHRVQVFDHSGKFLAEKVIAPATLSSGSAFVPVLSPDPQQTWLYFDPRRGVIARKEERLSRINRWLYHGFHSFDFPFLYYRRPLWDVVVVVLSAGGIALAVTTLTASWRRVKRPLRRLISRTGGP